MTTSPFPPYDTATHVSLRGVVYRLTFTGPQVWRPVPGESWRHAWFPSEIMTAHDIRATCTPLIPEAHYHAY